MCVATADKQEELNGAEGFSPVGIHLHLKSYEPGVDDDGW